MSKKPKTLHQLDAAARKAAAMMLPRPKDMNLNRVPTAAEWLTYAKTLERHRAKRFALWKRLVLELATGRDILYFSGKGDSDES